MTRRHFGTALTLALAGLTGCETFQRVLRKPERDPGLARASGESTEPETNKILDVTSDGKTAKPFFRSSRLSGGLSSEAREIEGSLGIH